MGVRRTPLPREMTTPSFGREGQWRQNRSPHAGQVTARQTGHLILHLSDYDVSRADEDRLHEEEANALAAAQLLLPGPQGRANPPGELPDRAIPPGQFGLKGCFAGCIALQSSGS